MDRITRSLMDEFAVDHGLAELLEDRKFEHFATFLATSRHYNEAFDTTDISTGSGGDTGIDAIAVVVNGSLVTDPELVDELASTNGFVDATFIFIQAERSSSFETAKIGQFGFGVVDFFKEDPSLPRNDAVISACAIMASVFRHSGKFKRGNPVVRMYYVTTGVWVGDAALVARQRGVVQDLEGMRLFRDVEFSSIGADQIQKLYLQTKNSIAREFVFSERTVIPEIPGVAQAYLGLLPAKEFLKLLQDEDGELLRSIFYDNVRDWQNYNPVNSEIRDTISSALLRPRFVLMNNGITVIAKALRATGNRFYIEDYQIVNGCQTSHVLFDQRSLLDDAICIPLRLIATQDEDVIGSIVKATNRQTEVKEEQLIALSDFQKKVEVYFQSFDGEGRRRP